MSDTAADARPPSPGPRLAESDLRAPFPYFGGKRRVAALVWERFGNPPNYVEPFAGSLAVLLARPDEAKVETVNDANGFISNFWRAVTWAPEDVAIHADWPVDECSLHAWHRVLVGRRSDLTERLMADPHFFDAETAGKWVWGICQWIGSGWCSQMHVKLPNLHGVCGVHGDIHRKLPSIGNAGRGGHRAPDVHEKRPHLMTGGKGINRQLPHVGDAGRGVHAAPRQLPHVGNPGRGVHRPCPSADRTAWLIAYMAALADRLRHVRVCCGDWTRVMGPSATVHNGLTGVFLDPPYSRDEREADLYAVESDVAPAVAAWARENGDNPLLRICLAGYEGEHEMPGSWEVVRWKAHGGYGSQGEGRGRENAHRECLWFSPHCLKPNRPVQGTLGLEGLT